MQKFYIVYLVQFIMVMTISLFITYVYYQFKKEFKYHFMLAAVVLYVLYLLFMRFANMFIQ